MKAFLERWNESPLLFDGAMGTELYQRGAFLNVCYDELCVTNPKLVAAIHKDYLEAGADVLESNSFGANPFKLREFGLADKCREINRAAVQVAREVAQDRAYVAGAVGPCLPLGRVLSEKITEEVRAAFAEQISALVEGGVDLLVLETFSDRRELEVALSVAAEYQVPIIASFTVNEEGETALGITVEQMAAYLEERPEVNGMGLNCGTGPAAAFDALERVLKVTGKPVLVMPNAGIPRQVEGRMLYLTNPEYFTTYTQHFIQKGARAVGGCCGTTPDHIRMAAKAMKNLTGVKAHVEIPRYEPEEAEVEIVPPEAKSRFANRLMKGEKVRTVEILPPKTWKMDNLLEKAKQCYFNGADAVNLPDGPRASSRISPLIAAIAIRQETGIEPILHYCCRDRNLIGMQSDLLGAYATGLRNFLVVTGDPPKLGDYPDATGVFDVDAVGLTRMATNLNRGRDLGGKLLNPPTGMFIGVGANPCAVDMDREIQHYQNKLDAGAEFAITQPVFDPEALFRFLDRLDTLDRQIPIVAGVWPLTSFKNASFMHNEVPGVEVPDSILERMEKCPDKESGVRIGVEIAQEICVAIADRVQGFQVSAPFGRVELALESLEAVR